MTKFLGLIPVALFLLAVTWYPFYLSRSYDSGISYWIGGGYFLDKKRRLRSKIVILIVNTLLIATVLFFTIYA